MQEFDLWANSKDCDLTRRNNFYDMQDIAYTSYLTDGDAFAAQAIYNQLQRYSGDHHRLRWLDG